MTADEIVDRFLSSIGIGQYVQWPVMRGNGMVIMTFREKIIRWAKVGDRVAVKNGGFVEKVRADGWVQWQFFHDRAIDDPETLTGKVLLYRPVEPQAPPDADLPQTPA